MASTAGAARALAAVRQRQLLAFLSALDTFHAAEQRIEAGIDPTSGAPLAAGAAPQALAAATSRLAEAMHAAIDAGWRAAFDTGMLEVHGGAAPPPSALRVLQAEAASQKAYATRFASDVAAGVPTQPGRWSEGRRAAAYADATEAAYQVAGGMGGPDGGLIWWRLGEVVNHCAECPIIAANSPYTRESIPTSPRCGATPCKSSCKCFLTVTPPTTSPQRTQAERDESAARDTPFEDRVYNPPPLPPGMRLPTAEERAALRDMEIQRNEARRRAHDAELAGNEREARIWRGRSRDLTGEIRRYADERGVHHVPTFRVGDVVTGRDIGRRDIDRLTHLRGIDGATMARAQSQGIADALAAAKRNLLADLETYPDMGGWTKADWTAALKKAGAPPSAFGGDLIRLGTESTCCGEAECGACRDRLSATVAASECGGACACRATTDAVGRAVLALEATAAPTPAADLPAPEDWRVVNAIGPTARATLRSHVAAFETLAKAGRRSGVAPYRVSVGPFADGWSDLVASGGTWVQGPVAEVERFFKAWAALATDDIVTATWQPM